MTIALAYSPCPNDCFMFDALVNQKIDTQGFNFHVELLDIDRLNSSLSIETFDVCKASMYALMQHSHAYAISDSGAALGFGCGPLLVCKNAVSIKQKPLSEWVVAIPGLQTTAHMLLKSFYPEIHQKPVYVFSAIEDAVSSEKVDAGLIIHESRFTYAQKGLECIADLGTQWEQREQLPIPLGGVGISKKLTDKSAQDLTLLIRKSIQFAFDFPESSLPYVLNHAQNLSAEVVQKHIELYVNSYSLSLTEKGRAAIQKLNTH